MRAVRIARLEFRRVARSRGLWLATGVFAVLFAGGTAIPSVVLDDPSPAVGTAFLLGPATDLVLPIIAILLSYAAIAGQRERGSVRLLLGTPHRRGDVLYGAIIGRVAVLWLVIFAGVVLSVITIWTRYGRPTPRPIAGFLALTLFASAVYVIVGVCVSAAVSSSIRSATALIAGFVVAHALWEPLSRGLHYVALGELPGDAPPRWYELLVQANPLEAYGLAVDGVLPESPHIALAIDQGGVEAERGELVGGGLATGDLLVSLAILAGWAVVAILVARARFDAAEIG